MSETPFFMTRMGKTYYEHSVPSLVAAVEKLADSVADSKRDPAVQELVEHAAELCDAAETVLDTEIVPRSQKTRDAFDNLRDFMLAVRRVLAKIR